MNMDTDEPLEGSSYIEHIKQEKNDEEDDSYDTMNLLELELAECVPNDEVIEYNSTDVIPHPKTKSLVCLHCLQELDNTNLNEHMMKTHNYRRVLFKCHNCSSTFHERQLLLIHRDNCKPQVKKRKRKTFPQLLQEVESCLEEGCDEEKILCPICVVEVPRDNIRDHMVMEHRKTEQMATCEQCQREFKSKLTLKEHVKLVHNAVPDSVECEMCGQKFTSTKYLSNHKRNVHPKGDKVHECDICGKCFKSHLNVHQHKKSVHPPPEAAVDCPHCGRHYKSREALSQHLRVAHGIR